MSSVCRVCLAGNKRLMLLQNKLLLNVYEKLCDNKFNSEDAKPRALCCVCYRKLLGCHTFSQMAVRSENIFNQLLFNGLEVTHEEIAKLNLSMEQSVATPQFPEDNTTNEGYHVTFKDEPISVKEEVTVDPLVEFEVYPKHCTERELKIEEESDEERGDPGNYPSAKVEENKPNDTNFKTMPHKRKSHSKYKGKRHTDTKYDRKYSISPVDKDMSSQAVEKLFVCHICEQKFRKKRTLDNHMRTHTGEKPFACDECSKHFNQKVHLVAHMRTHTGEKPFACSLCDKQYREKSNLVAHMRTHTGEKPFACSVCNKRFNQKQVLVRHTRLTHTGEKSFSCHVCKQQFERNMFLVDHMTTHPGEKPYSCIVCKKQFIHRNILAAHLRTHTGERPFSCNLCGKSFSQKSTLVGHIKTHTDGKELACHVCNKLFYKKNVLVDHMRTHPGEKPFACDVCDKKFTGINSLSRHKRYHTGANTCS